MKTLDLQQTIPGVLAELEDRADESRSSSLPGTALVFSASEKARRPHVYSEY